MIAATGGGPNLPTTEGLALSLPGIAGSIVLRELSINTAPASGGGTAIRVDGEVVWQIPRASDSVIPANATKVRVTSFRPGTRQVSSGYTITAPSRVHKITQALNALPVYQPGVGGCGAAVGRPETHLTFLTATDKPLALAVITHACGAISLSISGKTTLLTASLPNERHPIQPPLGRLLARAGT